MLTLSVPSLDPAFPHPAETRPKALSAWLARLPYASPMETAQQLVTALYALNRRPLDETVRATLLALYRPVVARVGASLETLLAESGVPPHAQQRQIGALLRELQIEHSIGYKHLLLALSQRRFGILHARLTADITARLMAALRDLQIACQLTRTLLPPGLWQELHALHAYAQTANLTDSAADDAPAPGLAYRQALLMALADPPHMSHAEIVHTRRYLDQFAALTQLGRAPVPTHRGFAIRTDDDAAPSLHTDNAPPASLWLDTEALCRRLHESLRAAAWRRDAAEHRSVAGNGQRIQPLPVQAPAPAMEQRRGAHVQALRHARPHGADGGGRERDSPPAGNGAARGPVRPR